MIRVEDSLIPHEEYLQILPWIQRISLHEEISSCDSSSSSSSCQRREIQRFSTRTTSCMSVVVVIMIIIVSRFEFEESRILDASHGHLLYVHGEMWLILEHSSKKKGTYILSKYGYGFQNTMHANDQVHMILCEKKNTTGNFQI